MYSKSDDVIQRRFDQVEEIERRVEQSTEYLDTERELGLIVNELLLLVSVKDQASAKRLIARMEEYHMHKYNLMMYGVVRSVEFDDFDD